MRNPLEGFKKFGEASFHYKKCAIKFGHTHVIKLAMMASSMNKSAAFK